MYKGTKQMEFQFYIESCVGIGLTFNILALRYNIFSYFLNDTIS